MQSQKDAPTDKKVEEKPKSEEKPKPQETKVEEEEKKISNTSQSKQEEIKKKDYQPPDPNRFLRYTLTREETGFTIEGTDYVFLFEDDGGWYDEYGNYYNADGQPDEYFDDDGGTRDLLGGYDIDGYDDDDYYSEQHYEKYDAFYANQENVKRLGEYLDDDPVKLQFSNISYKSPMRSFFDYLKKSGIKFYKEEFERFGTYGNGHKGSCQITCDNKNAAEEAIKLNGKIFDGRSLRVLVTKREDDEDEK